jgi:glyoxalase family protein
VTATVDRAQADLDFCLGRLALRLVKKTVNFDNHHVYHFYYGTESGSPGTLWTTFPYGGRGVRQGRHGVGQVTATAFSVPAESIGFWRQRFEAGGVRMHEEGVRFGEEVIAFADPSGLRFELIGTRRDHRVPWTGGGIGAENAIAGLHSVTLTVRELGPTRALMTGLLGYRQADESAGRVRLAVNGDLPGRTVDLLVAPDAEPGGNGLGTVHHVAMAIETEEQQLAVREELAAMGIGVTPVRDRCYFKSIYFREPGGVLFEVATLPPGFTADEPLERLGRELKLPPWEEPHRAAIEAGLEQVSYR